MIAMLMIPICQLSTHDREEIEIHQGRQQLSLGLLLELRLHRARQHVCLRGTLALALQAGLRQQGLHGSCMKYRAAVGSPQQR